MLQAKAVPFPKLKQIERSRVLAISQEAVDWALVFVSFAGITILATFGGLGAGVFLLASSLLALRRLPLLREVIASNLLLFLLPLVFSLSTLWSDFPSSTLRHSTEYLLTVGAAVVLASCVRQRVFTSACFSALLITLIYCLIIGLPGYLHNNENELYFILGSKNQLAEHGCFFLLVSFTVFFDPFQPLLLRVLAGTSIILAAFVIHVANSAGSEVIVIPAILAMLALALLSVLPPPARAVLAIMALLAVIAVVFAAIGIINNPSTILELLGKDSSLTGRTDLWETAQQYFLERPIGGVGYSGFWQLENPRARLLWIINYEEPGAGFNFHNLYLNTAVELGMIGLAALGTLLLSMTGRLFSCLIGSINSQHILGIGLFSYFLGISLFEVIQTYAFGLGTVLFYASCCYLKPRQAMSLAASLR
jgi:exopolysaccharide production protein ExoQ